MSPTGSGHASGGADGPVGLGPHFHVGIVVPDLAAACARFTELLGCAWGPIMARDIPARDARGTDVLLPNQLCYSTEAPHLELILETPGTPWVCNAHSNLHHLGFFSGALASATAALSAAGCPLEIMGGHGDGGPVGWAYHRDPLGVRIELVDEAIRASMETHLFRPAG